MFRTQSSTSGSTGGSTSAEAYISDSLRARRRVASGSRLMEAIDLRLNQFGALVLVSLLWPVLGLVAWLIWRADGAPILFAQYRVGRDGQLFRCFKFRTMYRDAEAKLAGLLASDERIRAEWERDQKLANDPRITRIGSLLRRTSLDELPQLINVLRGEMRLVGPRPITVAELERYGSTRWHYLSVQPGMTGLWQVSGRNNMTYAERVALDRHYVESKSMAMKLRILWRTIRVVIARDGAR